MGEQTQNSIHIEDGPNAGRIADPNVAQEIANLEKPARDLELGLQRQAETGLTPEQEKNVEVMKGLEEKYPKAFQTVVDSKGRKGLLTRSDAPGTSALGVTNVLLSQEGVMGFSQASYFEPFNASDINLEVFLDEIPKRQRQFENNIANFAPFDINCLTESGKNKVPNNRALSVRQVDLSVAGLRGALKSAFENSQQQAVLAEERQRQFSESVTAEKLIQDL